MRQILDIYEIPVLFSENQHQQDVINIVDSEDEELQAVLLESLHSDNKDKL
jgi:hypothetical protein